MALVVITTLFGTLMDYIEQKKPSRLRSTILPGMVSMDACKGTAPYVFHSTVAIPHAQSADVPCDCFVPRDRSKMTYCTSSRHSQ